MYLSGRGGYLGAQSYSIINSEESNINFKGGKRLGDSCVEACSLCSQPVWLILDTRADLLSGHHSSVDCACTVNSYDTVSCVNMEEALSRTVTLGTVSMADTDRRGMKRQRRETESGNSSGWKLNCTEDLFSPSQRWLWKDKTEDENHFAIFFFFTDNFSSFLFNVFN